MPFRNQARSCSVPPPKGAVVHLFAALALLHVLALPGAVGAFRVADAVGGAVDRSWLNRDAYYLRLSNTFRADAGITFASSELAAGYTLRLVPDPQTLEVAPFHIADLRYSYTTPRFSLSLTETLGIGDQTFLGSGRASPLAGVTPAQDAKAGAPAPPALATPGSIDSSLLPGARTLPSIAARSAAGFRYLATRRLSLAVAAGYQLYGGLDRDAQRYLALQHSLDGAISIAYGVSSRLAWVSALVASRGWNSSDAQFVLLTVSESCQYRWTATTQLDAGVGISVRDSALGGAASTLESTPVGSIGVTHTIRGRERTGALRFAATYAPLVDAVTGRVQNRLTASATASITQGDLHGGVGAGLSQVLPTDEPGAVGILSANTFGAYQITEWLGASLSAQIARQDSATAGSAATTNIPSGFTWGVYMGLYAVSPMLRF